MVLRAPKRVYPSTRTNCNQKSNSTKITNISRYSPNQAFLGLNIYPHMGNLRTKDLSKIGYHNDQLRSLVIGIVSKNFKHHSKQEILDLLQDIKNDPEAFLDNELTRKIAEKVIGKIDEVSFKAYGLRDEPVSFKTYGGKGIEPSAKKQMELASLLPVSIQGALMADAHMGFGLPIGGVLATDNAVIPYAVGMD